MKRSAISTTIVSGMGILGQFVRSLAGIAQALRHRREVRHLAEFDDRMLKDIGLTRSDVIGALDEPLYRNPSWVLVQSVERQSRTERPDHSAHQKTRPVVPMAMPAKRSA